MEKYFFPVLINRFTSAAIYLGVAVSFIIAGKRKKPSTYEHSLSFKELFFDYTNLPQLKSFTARDGQQLMYRHYAAQSDKVIILTSFKAGETGIFRFPTRDVEGFQDLIKGDNAYDAKGLGTLYLPSKVSRENKVAVMVILHGSGGEWSGRGGGSSRLLGATWRWCFYRRHLC